MKTVKRLYYTTAIQTWGNNDVLRAPYLPYSFLNSLIAKRVGSIVRHGVRLQRRQHFKFHSVIIYNLSISFQYLKPHKQRLFPTTLSAVNLFFIEKWQNSPYMVTCQMLINKQTIKRASKQSLTSSSTNTFHGRK